MLKSFDASGLQFAWDSTSIKLAETCLRKYQYKMIEGWQPERKSVHLLFGGWYATALEHFHKHIASDMDYEDAVLEVVSEALYSTWEYPVCDTCEGEGIGLIMRCEGGQPYQAEGDCPDCSGTGRGHGEGSPWLSDHNTKTRENLIRTIIWYLDQFRDDPTPTVILSNGEAAVEQSFRIDIDEGLILCGHLDRLVTYSGHYYVQDQKTTGTTITPRFFDAFNPDTQMSLYTFAGRMLFNIPVKGVMIDGAQIAVGFTRFERGFTFRDEASLNEWYDTAMDTITRTRKATEDNYFPMNASSCGNYGGCEFRNICSKSPVVREQFLKGDFVKGKRWDPLETR